MSRAQLDMFATDEDLFDAEPIVYRADPERVRRRLNSMLAEVRAADSETWDRSRQRLFETIVPQMSLWLSEEEAAQFKLDFETELARLA
ncbi:MAG: hypothetical protein ACYC0C_07955 [Devosia sp.]